MTDQKAMIDTAPRPDASLPEYLAARARQASDAVLATCACGGFVAALGVAYWRGPAWLALLSVTACIFAFGLWGIADRELGERAGAGSRTTIVLLESARAVAALVGALAAAALMVMALGVAIGPVIS